jgi:phosphate transport system protein
MLRQFLDMFRRESQLSQAFDRSQEMLRADREMFEAAICSLRERDDARLDLDIYAKDQLINAYEREVRRKVYTHLTVSSEPDLHAGLVLASVVIDIERIGDYTKNIVELALHHPQRLTCGEFENDVRKIESTVKTMFELLLSALPDSDEARAREVMSEHWWIARKTDEIVNSLIERDHESVSGKDAVATGLYVRYLKRTSAHLMNIASSIVNPFDRIGFRGDDPHETRS